MWIERFAGRALSRLSAKYFFEMRRRKSLAVLAYHEVLDGALFARHMDHVQAHYSPVSEAEVIAAAQGRSGLPERALFVTFDDGHRSVLEIALPILRDRGIPAVVYVVAGLLDTDQPFWWDEVEALVQRGGTTSRVDSRLAPADVVRAFKRLSQAERVAALDELRVTADEPAPRMRQLQLEELAELVDGGVAVGNHTLTHPCLHQCDTETIGHELEASQEVLAEALGRPPRTLAYPNGDQDPRVREAAARCGFEAAFLFDHRLSAMPPPDPLRISRLRTDADASLDRFKIIVSGLHPTLHHAIGRS